MLTVPPAQCFCLVIKLVGELLTWSWTLPGINTNSDTAKHSQSAEVRWDKEKIWGSLKTRDWLGASEASQWEIHPGYPTIQQSTTAAAGPGTVENGSVTGNRQTDTLTLMAGNGKRGVVVAQLHYFRKLIFQGVKVFPSLYNYENQFPFLK